MAFHTEQQTDEIMRKHAMHLEGMKERFKAKLKLCGYNNKKQQLINLIDRGIAFHHAGLKTEERVVIEEAYKCGVVKALACTTTLSAGV
eukprot:CAMPEP_0117430904 /NCGR_PEP_ID=MMETSP0758-20121206/10464_1 /TAXON_ID=63605 /ORGANISM="Percolomonas cosmopolitus, Strain AE-1 (ATCC 50343)" /LENGTH=88 /DNA_ID=CAMNT_0005219431 /DNA_START=678 /DNA_END=941 /DNA_ORIENTATION=+